MGITRHSLHKRRSTGGKKVAIHKKRKYDMGRQAANTKLSNEHRTHTVRGRGGHIKFRALRMHTGNFAWGGEATTSKTRIVDVMYNASNNELVRTKTLVKGAVIVVDATPFRQWYSAHYGVELGKKEAKGKAAEVNLAGKSNHLVRKIQSREKDKNVNPQFFDQFTSGRLLARVSSRPGQSGRCDGYLLEGKELDFYMRKLRERRGK